ncbi:hypothetical protein JCM33374_g2636 [Metschnikowia sp. JCM 33374]|nr:hypothetical protein JCM33374_g2636 [Metschnikowia sp. JCM 33374]
MVEVTENLRHYNFVGTLDQHLVYCVSELNVRLLALFNPYGYPETTYPEYVYKFARLEGLLEIWRAYFDGLDEVPTGVRMMFHIQEYRAREKIDLLGA